MTARVELVIGGEPKTSVPCVRGAPWDRGDGYAWVPAWAYDEASKLFRAIPGMAAASIVLAVARIRGRNEMLLEIVETKPTEGTKP